MDQGNRDEVERLRDALNDVRDLAWGHPYIGIDRQLADAFGRLAEFHGNNGAYRLMARTIEGAISAKSKYGKNHLEFADRLENLAFLYFALQGKTRGVGECFYISETQSQWSAIGRNLLASVIDIREKALGPDHPLVADSRLEAAYRQPSEDKPNLKSMFFPSSRPISIGEALQRTLEIKERVLGHDHPAVASVLVRYGDEDSLRRALQIRKQAFGPKHPLVAKTMEVLARGIDDETLFLEALAIREEVQGPWHPDFADSLFDLHYFYDRHDNPKEADETRDRTIEILLRVNAIDKEDWHQDQEIFEFVIPPTAGHFDVFERISVTEGAAHLITFTTRPAKDDSSKPQCSRKPMDLEEAMAYKTKPSDDTTLRKFAEAIFWGYEFLLNQEGWPPECYRLEELTDPLRYGTVPEGWINQLRHLQEIVRRGQLQ